MSTAKPIHSFGSSKFITLSDGRQLHYMERDVAQDTEQGTRLSKYAPTVVFESGLGASRNSWGLVQPVISRYTRAVVYDRAGTGKSDPTCNPRTIETIIGDLGQLLTALGQGPFILVGHSWGGAIVRAAAEANAKHIRGIVLVDQSDEHCQIYFSRLAKIHFAISRWMLPVLAYTGLYFKMGKSYGSVQPADVVADHYQEDFTVQAARNMMQESKQFVKGLELLKRNPPRLGDIEISVISGTLITKSERSIRPKLVTAHQQTAAFYSNARWIEAAYSGHNVMFTEPELIIEEIIKMLD